MRRTLSGSLVVLVCALTASGEVISFSADVVDTRTNWATTVSVPQFDPALGTLTAIGFSLTGRVDGTASYENLSPSPANITVNLSSEIKLQRPDATNLLVVLPIVSQSQLTGAYDGAIDFGGSSGAVVNALAGSASNSQINSPTPSDFTTFVGNGNVVMPVTAIARSYASGSGNMVAAFQTFAGAGVTVSYTYTPVPGPGSAALLGLAGMIAGRRRR
ncbi:MAG: choice-of-anchor E domain-containing protein [Phycisphaerae bacterium]|nr:choice-of-anchor E domain-containing protein [Phycisphaerae bacterium]